MTSSIWIRHNYDFIFSASLNYLSTLSIRMRVCRSANWATVVITIFFCLTFEPKLNYCFNTNLAKSTHRVFITHFVWRSFTEISSLLPEGDWDIDLSLLFHVNNLGNKPGSISISAKISIKRFLPLFLSKCKTRSLLRSLEICS